MLGLPLSLSAALPAHAAATDLTALSLEQLLEATIVGASKYEQKQSQVATAASVITREEIKAFGWRTLAEALASLPGVHTTYDSQYSYLGTRGFGLPGDFNTRVLLTLDGNRVNDAVFDQAYAGRDFPLDIDLIEHIEFIPGLGGAVYGQNAMFGVVNVITRRGATFDGAELAVAYQRPQATREGRASYGRQLDNGADVLLSASGLRSRGENRFFDFGAAGVSGVAAGLDGERDRLKNDPVDTYLSDPLVPGQHQRDRHLLVQLQYQDSVAENLQLTGRIFMGQEHYAGPFTYGGAPTAQVAYGVWQGAEALLSTAWKNHKLLLGAEYQANTRQDQSFQDIGTPANSVAVPGSGWRAGVYVQDFSYQNQAADPSLGGEKIDTLELVADHRVDPGLSLRGSAYYWNMRQLVMLGTEPASGIPQYQNGQNIKAHGVEVSAVQSWSRGARLRGSLSYQQPRYASGTVLANAPSLLGKLNFSTPLPVAGLRAGYELQYDSQRRAIDGTDRQAPCTPRFQQQLAEHARTGWRSVRVKLSYRF